MFIDHLYFSLAFDLFMVSKFFPLASLDQLNLTVCFNVPQSLKEETVQNSTDFQFCRKQPGEPHTSPFPQGNQSLCSLLSL